MRPLMLLLLAALLLPLAGAQSPLGPPPASIVMDMGRGLVEPRGDALEVPLTLEVPCDPGYAVQPATVTWAVTSLPSWASVVIEPASDSADVSRCEGGPTGVLRFFALASVTASEQAPAFHADVMEVEAFFSHPTRGSTTVSANGPLIAGFYSILDLQAPVRQLPAGDGLGAAFPLKVTNFGNANTKIVFSVASDEGVAVDLPEPLTLQSKQAGGRVTSADVVVVAHPERSSDRPLSFLLRWSSAYALDPTMVGDSGEIELIVLPGRGSAAIAALQQSAPEDDARSVPGLGTLGAAAALAGAALVLRRRR